MNCHREPTLNGILSDPIVRAVMEADGVNPLELEGMLREVADGWPSQETTDLTGPIRLTDDELRERMSGNICRCSAYPQIVAAIKSVAGDQA